MIHANFRAVASDAGLTKLEQDRLAGHAFLNSYIFEGAPKELAELEAPL